MDKILELKNIVHQKFLKIATRARIKEEDGKSTTHEFCCLMRLQALLIAISDTPNPTVEQLKQMEILANSICGRDRFIYKPVDWCGIDYDLNADNNDPPISACDIVYSNPDIVADNETLCSYIDKIIDTLNYEDPWIKFTVKSGLQPGRYEVGRANSFTTVGTTVNKTALNFYDIDRNGDLVQYPRELQNTLPDEVLAINFQTGTPKEFVLHGEYFDLERHKNQNLKAETEISWKSVWPCYVGIGPITALDNLASANTFIQSLTPLLDCKSCHELDISEGNVLYYFFPFEGMKKEFQTENAVMRGSYKGTLDGFRTKSMDDNGVPGNRTYGVIRTDEQGIRFLKFCVVDMLIEEEIAIPEVPVDVQEIAYNSYWTDSGCVKVELVIDVETYGNTWTEAGCIKIVEAQVDSYDSTIQVNGADNVLTWYLQLVTATENPFTFEFTTLIRNSVGEVISTIACTGSMIAGQTRYDSPLGGTVITEANGLTGLTREVITNSFAITYA